MINGHRDGLVPQRQRRKAVRLGHSLQSKDARKLAFASPALKQNARTLRALLGGGKRTRIISLEGRAAYQLNPLQQKGSQAQESPM